MINKWISEQDTKGSFFLIKPILVYEEFLLEALVS